MKKVIYYLLCFLVLNSCRTENKNELQRKEIKNISVLICGHGREIKENEVPKDSIIPKEFLFELYLIEIDSSGKLTTSKGFGEFSTNPYSQGDDLRMNSIVSKDTKILSAKKRKKILFLAQGILSNKPYLTHRSPTDSWLVKLKINNNTSIYYTGETLSSSSTLNRNYLEIVDELVRESPITVKYYR